MKAMTLNLSEWKIGSEDAQMTSFFDVWGINIFHNKRIIKAKEKGRSWKRTHLQTRLLRMTSMSLIFPRQ